MKNLRFDYEMQLQYTEPVSECHFKIKCIPMDTNRQNLTELKIELFPEVPYEKGMDSFGNLMIDGCEKEPHYSFSFHITGRVTTGMADYEPEEVAASYKYRYSHGLNCSGEGLKSYFEQISLPEKGSDYEKGVILMHRLYQDYHYEKNVTNVKTSAEEAWTLGRGVCQDYSHIFIALCHLAGIPARYVAGMMIGEGYSHAWVEILSEGKWYALDPTNDLIVSDSHIKLGFGRDAADCMINRGIMRGGGKQTQLIRINVDEVYDEVDYDKNNSVCRSSCRRSLGD